MPRELAIQHENKNDYTKFRGDFLETFGRSLTNLVFVSFSYFFNTFGPILICTDKLPNAL